MSTFACIIPWVGQPEYIDEAINSALNQKEVSFHEVLVCYDGSGPFVQPSSFQNEKVKVLKTQGREGAGTARNLGARASQSKFLTFLDHDDKLANNYLIKVSEAAKNGHELICGQLQYMGSKGEPGMIMNPSKNVEISTGACISKQLFERAGGYPRFQRKEEPKSMGSGDDVVLFAHAQKFQKVFFIPEVLAHYRIHESSQSTQGSLLVYCYQLQIKPFLNNEITEDEVIQRALALSRGEGLSPQEYKKMKNKSEARALLRQAYAAKLAHKWPSMLLKTLKAIWADPTFFESKIRERLKL